MMEKKKLINSLGGIQCDVDQDVMVTMNFTPSPVYRHLRFTVISDDDWCRALAWRKLCFSIVDCLPLTDLSSFQLGSLYNYVCWTCP